jgi:Chloroplast import apparatus Tic20-like
MPMSWRGSTTTSDRIFASLFYILPILDGFIFGEGLIYQLFGVSLMRIMLSLPLVQIYFAPFVSFVVFFAIYVLVVRNENIRHFIRFNAMQAILIGIVLSLVNLVWSIFAGVLTGSFIQETLFSCVFLGMVAAVGYSIVQSILGRYAEIPTISEAVYMQVR